jgi:acyl carrier protein phosphodiesterase
MNYLAHFLLSGNNNDLIIGNLIADTLKGPIASAQYQTIKPEIVRGIKLHRAIDTFTDNHPLVKESIHLIQPKYHKYSGVLVDMYYDHFLARNWNKFHDLPIELYASNVYQVFENRKDEIPESVHKMLSSMISRDWLSNYRFKETMEWAFQGLARRAKFNSGMELGVEDLMLHYGPLQEHFLAFFPQIQDHCTKFLNETK